MSTNYQDRKAKAAAAAGSQPRRGLVGLIAGLVTLVLLGGVLWGYLASRGDSQSTASAAASATTPPNANADTSGIVLSKGNAGTPTLAIYQDYQCPICKQYHEALAGPMATIIKDKLATVEIRTMTFLDQNLRNDSSTRAGYAAACADTVGAYQKYYDTVYDNQPATEGQGYTDEQLTKTFAATAGITGDNLATFTKCYNDRSMKGFVDGTQQKGDKAGITGTPTYQLNGTKIDFSKIKDADAFLAYVKSGGK